MYRGGCVYNGRTYSVVVQAGRAEENQFRTRARKPFAAPREDGTGRTAWISGGGGVRLSTVRSVNGMSRAIRCVRGLSQRLRRRRVDRAVAISLVRLRQWWRRRRLPLPKRILPLPTTHPGPPAQSVLNRIKIIINEKKKTRMKI